MSGLEVAGLIAGFQLFLDAAAKGRWLHINLAEHPSSRKQSGDADHGDRAERGTPDRESVRGQMS